MRSQRAADQSAETKKDKYHIRKHQKEDSTKKGKKKKTLPLSEQADMSAIKFVPILSTDYIKFVQRLLSFYSYNFKQATADVPDEEQFSLEEELNMGLEGFQNKKMVFPRNTTLVVESKLRLEYLLN